MAHLRRMGAVVVIVGILAGQVAMLLPLPIAREWYWPFIAYPMYAWAHYRGDVFTLRELRGVPCSGAAPRRLTSHELGIYSIPFDAYLAAAAALRDSAGAPVTRDSAVAALEWLVARRAERYCALEVRSRSAVIGRPETYSLSGDWRLEREWALADSVHPPWRPSR